MAAEGRRIESETGGALLHDRRHVTTGQALPRDPLRLLVHDPGEYRAGGALCGVHPRPEMSTRRPVRSSRRLRLRCGAWQPRWPVTRSPRRGFGVACWLIGRAAKYVLAGK